MTGQPCLERNGSIVKEANKFHPTTAQAMALNAACSFTPVNQIQTDSFKVMVASFAGNEVNVPCKDTVRRESSKSDTRAR